MFKFKKRSKTDVVSTEVFSYGGKTATGKNRKDGVLVKFKDGDSVTLLTPSGKGKKYVEELKGGVQLNINLGVKTDKKGKPRILSDTQRAYRSGYLQSLQDGSKAYKAKKSGVNKRSGVKI